MINESITDVVFYYTSLKSAYNILKTGSINLTPTIRNSSEEELGSNKFYFMSLTRSRYGAYHTNSRSGVLFELDGKRLSQRYSGKAADYWDTMKDDKGMSMKDEMEDRLFSDNPTLDIIPFIKNISILYDEEFYTTYIFNIYVLAKKNKISVHVYNDPKPWLANNKAKALSHDDIKTLKTEIPSSYRMRTSLQSDTVSILELYYKKSSDELTKSAKRLKQKMRYIDEFVRSIKTDIHNESGSIANGASENVTKLIQTIKASGHRKLRDFLEEIIMKWDIIDREEEKKDFLKRNRELIREFMRIIKGKDTINLEPFNNDESSVGNRIRNLLFGMLRNGIIPDKDILGWELDDNMSGYRLETTINEIVEHVLNRVGIQSS